MSFRRAYLEAAFPGYDPHACTTPWKIDYRGDAENRKLVAWQLQSFAYFQSLKQCQEEAEPGLSLRTPGIPFCLCASDERGPGVHLFVKPEHVAKVFEPATFPFLLVSAALPSLPCTELPPDATPEQRVARRCRGAELVPTLRNWLSLLKPGGVLAAIVLDESKARVAGGSLLTLNPAWTHAWTPAQFQTTLLDPVADLAEIEAVNTLGNNFAFDLVLRRR